MEAIYTEKARQWGEGYALLHHATKRLEEILGPSASLVRAEWDRREDARGRTLYTLRLSDWTGETKADFAPDELASADQMRYRLHRVWGDLLQVRSQKQLEQLTGPSVAGD